MMEHAYSDLARRLRQLEARLARDEPLPDDARKMLVEAVWVAEEHGPMLVRLKAAMGPPLAASGDMCPMAGPRVAPEKRPSVISATSLSFPIPHSRAVVHSISTMPGLPFGPS